MSYRNIAIITAVVLFCIVFPSAQVRHAFSDRYGIPTAPTPNASMADSACDTSNDQTVDHTVCGSVLINILTVIMQNVRGNLALVGIVDTRADSPNVAGDVVPGPGSGAMVQPPTAVASATAIPVATQTIQPSATMPRSIQTHTPTLQRLQTITVSATVAQSPQVVQATQTTVIVATETSVPATETSVPATVTVAPPTATAVVLLPQSILDGFRTRMPVAGYWESNKDGVYVAVGSFKYLRTFYSSEAPDTKRFVVCSILIANTRSSGSIDVYVDRTNISLTDIDGKQTTALVASDDLDNALQAARIAPGQRVGGQIAFLVGQYAAPAQITLSTANMDEYLTRTTQTIELRVWPIVP
ncbi:MAG: DUF4352 domain-containing protein [Roseiflexaceae bacterium]|jgi:hypothetical protein|nr:DUF4352 domain-containing protein [Chloroflexaceae bacterium]